MKILLMRFIQMLIIRLIMRLVLTLMLMYLWHYFGVAAVERKWEECVDENADKLDHLESGQIPGR